MKASFRILGENSRGRAIVTGASFGKLAFTHSPNRPERPRWSTSRLPYVRHHWSDSAFSAGVMVYFGLDILGPPKI